MSYDEKKFAEFNKMLEESDAETVVIAYAEVLGDDYEELVINLRKLARAGKTLAIVRASPRGST